MMHTERTYLDAQEIITIMAFDALALSRQAPTPEGKLTHHRIFNNLVDGSARLSRTYKETLRRIDDRNQDLHRAGLI